MGKGSPAVAWGKPKLNMKSFIESELAGIKDMMLIMLWICNSLLKQREGIGVDLLLDNKSPSLWEQGGKTPSWKGRMYDNVRLIDTTMGKKQSVNPMVYKWLLVKVTCEKLVSKCCINEFGAIINVEEVSHTTGVSWGLYSVGYCSLNVVQLLPVI